jgi:hypothetical protein
LADILLIVIDLNENYEKIIEQGIYDFLKMHLNELNINKNSKKNFEEWIANKDIIISMNKKDLIENHKNKKLNEKLNEFTKNFKTSMHINRISCVNNDVFVNDLNELSDQLKNKLEKLYANNLISFISLLI